MTTMPYVEFSTFLREKYGETVYRIPIDIGFSCPNRSANREEGGCTFCNSSGSKAQHLINKENLAHQVQAGIALAKQRYHAKYFMAYFQAYTSTYAPIETIRSLFEEVLQQADFRVVVISTRPDCLPPEVLDYLSELAQRYDLWVELGVQTIHDSTLAQIRRGHTFSCSREAILALAQRHIQVAVHVILGLPGETMEMMMQTAEELAKLPISGIKLHHLQIVKNTPMEIDFKQGKLKALDEQEYAEILMQFLRRIPSTWPIMRLMSETSSSELLAPIWWLNKNQFIAYVQKQMQVRCWRQGDLYTKTDPTLSVSIPLDFDQDDKKSDLEHAEVSWFADYMRQSSKEKFVVWVLPIEFGNYLSIVKDAAKSANKKLMLYGLSGHLSRYVQWCEKEGKETDLLDIDNIDGSAFRLFWGHLSEQHCEEIEKPDIVIFQSVHCEQSPELLTDDFVAFLKQHLQPSTLIFSPCREKKFRLMLKKLSVPLGKYQLSNFHGGTLAGFETCVFASPLSAKEQVILKMAQEGESK